jgi:hypothetical protein
MTNHAAVLGINFGNVGFLADSGSGSLSRPRCRPSRHAA